MELKEGMYVRYTRGAINGYVSPRIARIVDCSDNELIKIDNGQIILRSDVIKASHNLIDLIEVGDYVNGSKVIDIVENDVYVSNFYEEQCIGQVSKKNIKSIVTKEQFESMKYVIEK